MLIEASTDGATTEDVVVTEDTGAADASDASDATIAPVDAHVPDAGDSEGPTRTSRTRRGQGDEDAATDAGSGLASIGAGREARAGA